MKIIKRSGKEVDFDINKIIKAVSNANKEVVDSNKLSDGKITELAKNIEHYINNMKYQCNVENIQDLVEIEIMRFGGYEIAQKYIKYRGKRALLRQENTIDKAILTLVDGDNEDIKQENSRLIFKIVKTK